MQRPPVFQALILVSGVGLFLFALSIDFRLPGAMQFWIWPETPPLGCVFVAAMLAGGGAPLVWIGLSRQFSAIRAAMLTGMVANTGIALHLLARHALSGNERYLPFSALFAGGSILAAAVFARMGHAPAAGDRDSPPIIRWVFLLFSAILLPVGVGLVLGVPHIFPIPLTTDMAAVYGWFFLGSFAYYAYGFWKPSLLNSTGQLLSFVMYDVFMLRPYLQYRSAVYPGFRISLFVYLGVLLSSALFCGYFLLVDPRTRLFKSHAPMVSAARERG